MQKKPHAATGTSGWNNAILPAIIWLGLTSLLFILSLLFAVPLLAQESAVIRLSADDHDRIVGSRMQILEDPNGNMSFSEVEEATGWKWSPADEPNLGFTTSAWWSRFAVTRSATDTHQWYLVVNDAILNHVDVYFKDGQGNVTHKKGGGWIPVTSRDVPYRTHAFKIPASREDRLTVYIRVQSRLAVVIPAKLLTDDEFTALNTDTTWFYTLYFGCIFAILIFNMMVWVRMGDRTHLYYCAFTLNLVTASLSLSGLGTQYLWPANPQWDNILVPASLGGCAIFGLIFCNTFLGMEQNKHRRHSVVAQWITGTLALLSVISALTDMLMWACIFATIAALLGVGAVIHSVFQSIHTGNPNAMTLLIGWTGLLLGVVVFALRTFGLIENNAWTFNAFQIGSTFECFMLMYALIEKSRKTQEELIETHKRQGALLEAQVKARTAELVDTQQKLVASEKMAALGVFTAGMAHEINNPANFISAGAQNAEAQISRFRAFIGDLLDEEADPEIQSSFDEHFSKLSGSLDVIRTGISRIEHVVRHLRANHPEGLTGMQPADVIDTLEAAWRVLLPTIRVPVVLTTQFESRPQIPCHIAEINQVFLALLSNAAHAIEDCVTPSAVDYAGEIRLASRDVDGRLLITVTDNGTGIPTDTIDKVFDPFFTTKTVGRGAGLGLSMARDVISRHGGIIQAESRSGRGSTFTLMLPLA